MPSNIQSLMTSLTWHNAIPTWQVLSYFVISPDCTRTPKSRNYSSPPSHQADNTQYREPGPKFVANWQPSPILRRSAIIHFISHHNIWIDQGKSRPDVWYHPAVLFSDHHRVNCRRREIYSSHPLARLYFLLPLIGSCYTIAITSLSHSSDNGATLLVAKIATGGNVVIICSKLLLAMRLVKASG